MSLKLIRADLMRTQNFIGGRWCDTQALLPVTNPADDSLITQVPELVRPSMQPMRLLRPGAACLPSNAHN